MDFSNQRSSHFESATRLWPHRPGDWRRYTTDIRTECRL